MSGDVADEDREDPVGTGAVDDNDDASPHAPGDRWLRRALIAGSLAAALVVAVVAAVLMWPSGGTAEAAPKPGSADAGFARDMSAHHQQAVEMSFVVRDRTGDEEVRRLAYDIINTQANQRGMMLGWLEAWGLPKSSQRPPMSWMDHDMKGMDGMKGMRGMPGMDHHPHGGALMPGMATDHQMDELRRAKGKEAEILYLKLMTAHHKGGITMADAAAGAATTEEVRNLASGMSASQQSEVGLMADMLEARGATP